MRIVSALFGFVSLVFGVFLLVSVLYDATELARFLGLDPAGNEAIVAVVGLVLAALAIGAGAYRLRTSPRSLANANAG